MAEQGFMIECMQEASRLGGRLFRNNVGLAWVGVVMSRTARVLSLRDWRPLHAGLCEGSSDLIGWTPVIVTPAMVGMTVAVFTAIETKNPNGKGRVRPEQQKFVDLVVASGGIAGIPKNEEELTKIWTDFVPSKTTR